MVVSEETTVWVTVLVVAVVDLEGTTAVPEMIVGRRGMAEAALIGV
jgi:hypothetical protein